VRCSHKNPTPNIEIVNKEVEKVIHTFIDSIYGQSNDSATMEVEFHMAHDTVQLYIWDDYPDKSMDGVLGYTMIDQHTVFFIGDSIYNNYFKVSGKIKIPSDVVKRNKKDHFGFYNPKRMIFWSTKPAAIHPVHRER